MTERLSRLLSRLLCRIGFHDWHNFQCVKCGTQNWFYHP